MWRIKKAGGFLVNALKRSSNPCSIKHGRLWAIPISDACEQNALHKCVGCMPTLCSSWKAVIFQGTCIEYRCDDSCNHSASEAMQSNANCSSMQIKMRPWVPFKHLLKFWSSPFPGEKKVNWRLHHSHNFHARISKVEIPVVGIW